MKERKQRDRSNPVKPKIPGLTMKGNRILGLTAQPVKPNLSLYNPAIHKPGDKVMVRPPYSKKLIETVIPELDADGNSMPNYD